MAEIVEKIKKIGGKIKMGHKGERIDRTHTVEKYGCEVDEEALERGEETTASCYHIFENPENNDDVVRVGVWRGKINPNTGKTVQVLKKRGKDS